MYRLGLDIGIKSVGWCVMECDESGEPKRILALNSRIFKAAEVADMKKNASLTYERRMARSSRRLTRRRAFRLERLRNAFEARGVKLFESDGDELVLTEHVRNLDVLALRVKGLSEKLTAEEFAYVLYSMAKHRGFKSNKKSGATSAEDGKLKKAISENAEKIKQCGCATVGEYLYKEYAVKGLPVRNKGGKYNLCFSRDMIADETCVLFEKQRAYGNDFASREMEEEYLTIFNSQRNFDEGPGKGSNYTGGHEVKKCEFYEEEDVSAKGTYTNEWATAYQKINNLAIILDGDRRRLTDEEREIVVDLARKKGIVKYKDVRKALGLVEDYRFNALNYGAKKKGKKSKSDDNVLSCEDSTFINTSKSKDIVKVLPDDLKTDVELIDEIAEICTKYSSQNLFEKAIEESAIVGGRIDDETIAKLCALDMTGYGHLSLRALREMMPHLEAGLVYSEAVEKIGFSHSRKNYDKQKYLGKNQIVREKIRDIISPVVRRSVSQTVKVIDAIIREYGSPYAVNIELARDMSLSRDERDKLDKEMKTRAQANEAIAESLRAIGVRPTATNMLKKKLYDEQDCKCIYSGKPLEYGRLYEDGYCEIDHVIPYSRSFDDSYSNKVLVLKEENQNKKQNTPYEYFERIGRDFDEFTAFCKAIYGKDNSKKVELLLKKKVNEDERKSRALNDTRYASRLIANVIDDFLIFDDNAKGKRHTLTVKGAITAYLRRYWGIQKIREDGDKHHAVDAAVIACVTRGIEQKIEKYNQAKEINHIKNGEYVLEDGEIVSEEYYDKNKNLVLPFPYKTFRDELSARTLYDEDEMKAALRAIGFTESEAESAKPFIVSRMVTRKGNGKLHEDTVFSAKYANNGNPQIHGGENIIVKRTPLQKLKLKDGEIEGYFNPSGDRLLYEAIKQRLEEFGGDGAKAFPDDRPLRKPCKNGEGNIVRAVKTYEKYNGGGIELQKKNGVAKNDTMIRVDVYSKNGKYYGVPIYVADLYKGDLPNQIATANKPRCEWRVVDETYTFETSLHKNDLIRIENDKPIEMKKKRQNDRSSRPDLISFTNGLVYFDGFDIATAGCKFDDTTDCYTTRKGLQNMKKITKCEIDVLGNVVEITRKPKAPEKLCFKNKRDEE